MPSKTDIREQMIAARAALTPSAHSQASAACRDHLQKILKPLCGMQIGIYQPFRGEVDILPLLETLSHMIALPCIDRATGGGCFREWKIGAPTIANSYGIPEPPEHAHAVEPDVLLIPLVAFDRRGYRIGYGSGFYDRCLATLRATKRITAIGIGFALQEIDQVPNESFDQRLDRVVTEKEIIEIK